MQAKTTFQKLFFGLIFVVTILTFAKMYVDHKHNLAQMDAVVRTRALLDYITTGETQQDFLLWPYDQDVIDSAKVILDYWGDGAVFDEYAKVATDSSLSEHIAVTYNPKSWKADTLSDALHKTKLLVDWHKNTIKGAWRVALSFGVVADTVGKE